jgi:septal ring factor EnvC (AmiA/AmiB activator)
LRELTQLLDQVTDEKRKLEGLLSENTTAMQYLEDSIHDRNKKEEEEDNTTILLKVF